MLGTTSLAGLIPQLRKPLSDPLERFSLYDCPTGDDVVRSAHLAASTRGIDNAFGHRPFIPNAMSIPGLIPEFGGHPHTRPKQPLPASLARIAHPHAARATAPRTVAPVPTFRELCAFSLRKPVRTARPPLDPIALEEAAEEDNDTESEVRAAEGAARARARASAELPAHHDAPEHSRRAHTFAPISVALEGQPAASTTPSAHPAPRDPSRSIVFTDAYTQISNDGGRSARDAARAADARVQAARVLAQFTSLIPRMRAILHPGDEAAPADACRSLPLVVVVVAAAAAAAASQH